MKRVKDSQVPEYRLFLMVWLGFLFSQGGLYVVGYCFRGPLSNAFDELFWVLIGAGVANATAAQVFLRQSARAKREIVISERSRAQTAGYGTSAKKPGPLIWYIVACLLNEGIALYGLVWSMNGGSMLTHAAFAVTAILLHATTFPRDG